MKKLANISLILLILTSIVGFKGADKDAKTKVNPRKYARLKAKADRSYEAYSYERAINQYKRVLESTESDASVELKLANSYRLLNQPQDAEFWYRAVLDKTTMTDKDMLNFGQVLSANGKYDEALAIYEEYQHKEDWVDDHVVALKNVDRFYVNEIAFEIQESYFNSIEKDFSPTLRGDEVIFVTGRRSSGILKPEYNWDGTNFLDLFVVKEGGSPEKIHRGINTRYHEGPAAFYQNGEKMFFTRNNYHKKKAGESEEGVNMLKIFYSEKKDENKWKKPVEFTHNNDHYSTGHPTISSDGKTLYFASDMPGGFGGVDIWKSEYTNGMWSTPENMGPRYNTAEDEMFPFLYDDMMYFASSGHEGLGGLDLFRASLNDERKPRNLGFPLNTNADDFGITLNEDNAGYFSSNRSGGMGDDDIYNVQIYDYIITVNLIDAITGEPLSGGMDVTEFFPPEIEEFVIAVEESSKVVFRSLKGSKFEVDGVSEGYVPNMLEIGTADLPKTNGFEFISFDLPLTPLRKAEAEIIVVENNGINTQVISKEDSIYTDHDKTVDDLKLALAEDRKEIVRETLIKNIYYDFDKYNIREDAALELDKLFEFLNETENAVVTLSSHTDVRGSIKYNEKLAQNRALSAKQYLIEKGIDASRIEITSFGETKTFNNCPESDCSKDQHQLNRRTEITIGFR